MFSRQTDKEAPQASQTKQQFGAAAPPAVPRPTSGLGAARAGMAGSGAVQTSDGPVSVIGSDLAIIGSGLKIVSKGTLQIDGEVQGDVLGSKVVIGQSGKVTGLVGAEHVIVDGTVFGTIKGIDVVLRSSAEVEGDIHHQTFTLEQGGKFEGRSRRPKDTATLLPNLSGDESLPTAAAEPVAEPETTTTIGALS